MLQTISTCILLAISLLLCFSADPIINPKRLDTMLIKNFFLLLFSFSTLVGSTQPLPEADQKKTADDPGKTWRRYTMAGPGHKASAEFPPYQGSDRTEWMHFFRVSEANPTFMMVGLDMTGAYISQDGREFKPVDLPFHRFPLNVSFSPHDGNTGYMLYGHACGSVGACYPGESVIPGIWRTRDKGETWEQIYTMPPNTPKCKGPGGKNQIQVDPHPNRNDHIYFGSIHRGLLRTVDDGESWQVVAFEGHPIKTMAAAKGPENKTILYVIVGEKGVTGGRNMVPDGHLYRVEVEHQAPYEVATFKLPGGEHFFDVAVSPDDWSSGMVIGDCRDNARGGHTLIRFEQGGQLMHEPRTSREAGVSRFVDVHINPQKAEHVVVRSGSGSLANALQYSLDGGRTWNDPYPVIDGHIPNMISYNPTHHTAPLGAMRNVFHQGQGSAVGFDARDPRVVYWWTENYIDKTPLKSTNYGATWMPFAYGGPFKLATQIAIGPKGKHMGIGRAEHGIITSRDSGLSWIGSTHLTDPTFKQHLEAVGNTTQGKYGRGIAYKPDNSDVVVSLFGSPAVILVSHDGGMNWKNTGVYAGDRASVYWSPANPSVVYAGQQRSRDGGTSWESIDRHVLAVSSANAQMLVGNKSFDDPQFSLSFDGGDTWKDITPVPEENFPGTDMYKSPLSLKMATGIKNTRAVAIDPRPAYDAGNAAYEGVRILAAGRKGVYEYTASAAEPYQGEWNILNNGFEPSIHFSRVEAVPWIGHVAIDPRPGMGHVVYACKSADPDMCRPWRGSNNPNMLHSNGQARRPLYRSIDGGKTWETLHAPEYSGIPDHLDVTALEVGPAGGVYVDGYSGIYALPGVAAEPHTGQRQ